jgi:hypothetical protein
MHIFAKVKYFCIKNADFLSFAKRNAILSHRRRLATVKNKTKGLVNESTHDRIKASWVLAFWFSKRQLTKKADCAIINENKTNGEIYEAVAVLSACGHFGAFCGFWAYLLRRCK